MSAQHTPGPWFLEGNWSDQGRGPLGGWVSSNPPAGMPIFELGPVVGDRAEIVANARLIAAAPDLLAACQQALELHEPDEGIGHVLQAAIAKALGA